MTENHDSHGAESPGEGHGLQGPYGPNTRIVRSLLVSLSSASTRDWIVFTHEYKRRQQAGELAKADAALAEAVNRGALEDARDAVVGPVVQLAGRVASAPDGAAAAAGLDLDDLAEAVLAGALALVAAPLMPELETRALLAHLERFVPESSPD
jgi:hypothetical protein